MRVWVNRGRGEWPPIGAVHWYAVPVRVLGPVRWPGRHVGVWWSREVAVRGWEAPLASRRHLLGWGLLGKPFFLQVLFLLGWESLIRILLFFVFWETLFITAGPRRRG